MNLHDRGHLALVGAAPEEAPKPLSGPAKVAVVILWIGAAVLPLAAIVWTFKRRSGEINMGLTQELANIKRASAQLKRRTA